MRSHSQRKLLGGLAGFGQIAQIDEKLYLEVFALYPQKQRTRAATRP